MVYNCWSCQSTILFPPISGSFPFLLPYSLSISPHLSMVSSNSYHSLPQVVTLYLSLYLSIYLPLLSINKTSIWNISLSTLYPYLLLLSLPLSLSIYLDLSLYISRSLCTCLPIYPIAVFPLCLSLPLYLCSMPVSSLDLSIPILSTCHSSPHYTFHNSSVYSSLLSSFLCILPYFLSSFFIPALYYFVSLYSSLYIYPCTRFPSPVTLYVLSRP